MNKIEITGKTLPASSDSKWEIKQKSRQSLLTLMGLVLSDFSLLIRNQEDPKAHIVVSEEGGPTVPGRRSTFVNSFVPAPAAVNMKRGNVRVFRVILRRIGVVFRIVIIGTPFTYVPVHIVQSPVIRFLLLYFLGLFTRIGTEPSHGIQVLGIIFPSPCPAGILPLCLGRQLNLIVHSPTELFAKFHAIVPEIGRAHV